MPVDAVSSSCCAVLLGADSYGFLNRPPKCIAMLRQNVSAGLSRLRRYWERNLADCLNFFQNVAGGEGFWDFTPRRAFWTVRAGFNLNEVGLSPILDLGTHVRQALTVTVMLDRFVKELALQFRCILRSVLDALRHVHDELRHSRRALNCRVLRVDQCFGTPLERPLHPDWIPALYYVDYTRRPPSVLDNVEHEADRV